MSFRINIYGHQYRPTSLLAAVWGSCVIWVVHTEVHFPWKGGSVCAHCPGYTCVLIVKRFRFSVGLPSSFGILLRYALRSAIVFNF